MHLQRDPDQKKAHVMAILGTGILKKRHVYMHGLKARTAEQPSGSVHMMSAFKRNCHGPQKSITAFECGATL